jgi:hypothetical protein
VLWTRDFLKEQGYSSSEKSRHIAIRYFWVADRIDSEEVVLEYLRTKDMVAEIMTKPLQGALFRKMRGLLLNIE